MSKDKNTLGRGLSALLGEVGVEDYGDLQNSKLKDLNVDFIKPGKGQPRSNFKEDTLEALTNSIKQQGVLQPLLVRKIEENLYEIIAGERRWRASKAAGLSVVPVLEISCNNTEAIEIGLIENLQRDDLNPMEEAESFKRLMDEHNKTQEQIAKAISKSRSYVANTLRLNNLPDSIKQLVISGKLSAGHARSIANSSDIENIANKIIEDSLSVRESEALVRKQKTKHNEIIYDSPPNDLDIDTIAKSIEEKVNMKTKLQISKAGGTGTLSFYFNSLDQLDSFINKLG